MHRYVAAALLLVVLGVIGCVKVQTGQTQDEQAESAERRADVMRRQWASQLQSASPVQLAGLVGMRIDTTAGILFRFADQIEAEWRKGNVGRGEEVPASEMRQVIDAWSQAQEPILRAYEDNIDQGVAQVQASNQFDRPLLNKLEEMTRQYDEIYSAVFYPNGTVEDYHDNIQASRRKLEETSEEFRLQLDNYR